MIHLIGDKSIFAIEFEILDFKAGINSKVLIWFNNVPVGNFRETGYLTSVLKSLDIITRNPEKLHVDNFYDLSCKEIFYTITPLYNNPNSFFDLTEQEQEELEKYDKFLFEWGDAFNDWYLKVVVNGGKCKFLWVYTPLGDEDSFEVRNNIQCYNVDLKIVKKVYDEIAKLIPDNLWPSIIAK